MNTKIIQAACLLLLSAGCKKDVDSGPLPDGNYAGTFRITALGEGPWPVKSHVTLRLHDGAFEGNSDSPYTPMICYGTFTRNAQAITFNPQCARPAIPYLIPVEFTWDITTDGDSIRLTSQSLTEQKFRMTLKRVD